MTIKTTYNAPNWQPITWAAYQLTLMQKSLVVLETIAGMTVNGDFHIIVWGDDSGPALKVVIEHEAGQAAYYRWQPLKS